MRQLTARFNLLYISNKTVTNNINDNNLRNSSTVSNYNQAIDSLLSKTGLNSSDNNKTKFKRQYQTDYHVLKQVYTETGAIEQIPKWYRLGVLKVIANIFCFVMLGSMISKVGTKFLPDNQYYQYVIQARLQGRYEDVTEWPKLGTETYLKQLNSKDIHRCIILAKGSYQECQDKLGCALVRTLKDNSRLSVHNPTFMSEYFEPF